MARILIIDDDAVLRMMVREMLALQGYDVMEADDGRAGVSHDQPTPADLIILDLFMPEQDGLETIRVLRQMDPTVNILAISGGGVSGMRDFLKVALLMGAQRTLQKPFSMHALLEMVRDLTHGTGRETHPSP